MARDIASLLAPVGADSATSAVAGLTRHRSEPSVFRRCPPNVDGTRYFWYHHSNADTMDKLDPREVAECVALMAVFAYVVADMPETFPRAPVRSTAR